jgi:hypothetical protein
MLESRPFLDLELFLITKKGPRNEYLRLSRKAGRRSYSSMLILG